MNENRKRQHFRRAVMLAVVLVTLAALLGIEYSILNGNNRIQAFRIESILADQVGTILESNLQKTELLREELKENYISKAKTVAYMLEKSPELERDVRELERIAGLMSIDEIHIFDDAGTIIAGSVPKYFGYSFNSGEQIAYFRPMLKDRTRSMCQDVTPNTAEGKEMMYAICWNDSGTKMIQVGIEPLRLLEELKTGKISEVISSLPAYEGMEILVASRTTDEVAGATNAHHLGKTLKEIGVDRSSFHLPMPENAQVTVEQAVCYCVLKEVGDYSVVVIHKRSTINQGIPVTLITLSAYLILAVGLMTVIILRMQLLIHDEQKNANTDSLTGLLNRRAYENEMNDLSGKTGRAVTFLSLDLNGLKETNDTFGHEAGDEMIQGIALCLKGSFGKYGAIYRTGGDEFAGLLHLSDEEYQAAEHEMRERMEEWNRKHSRTLSASWASADNRRDPGLTPHELARLADERMYRVKAEYYKTSGKDRRR